MSTVQQIIDKYGPTVWAAAQRQVVVDMWLSIGLVVLFSALLVVDYKVVRWTWRYAAVKIASYEKPYSYSSSESDWKDGRWFVVAGGVVLAAIFLAVALSFVFEAANDIANPTWQAINSLKP